jgi:hypothetical protein
MIADAFLQCRVTSQTKSLVRALAEREGITESKLVKQLLEVVLRTAAPKEPSEVVKAGSVSRERRLYVRLAREDWRLLQERSAARGVPCATYVSLLVRSHLRDAVPLPKKEFLALRQAVLELTAIGRNLNQIARTIHQGGQSALPGRAEVGAMLKVADGLRDHFKGLLKANELSWRQGYAKTSG